MQVGVFLLVAVSERCMHPRAFAWQGGGGDGLYTVVAVYPYSAAQSDDLTMAKGDVFTVLEDNEPNWCV